jgi:superfamily II DNA or RNA helicase
MATGTGKTITALGAAVRLLEREGRLALVIAVPYQHLVSQWQNEAGAFGFRSILAYQSKKRWLDPLSREIITFNGGYRPVVCIITTHSTFISEDFQASLSRILSPALLIADEAHHLGAQRSRQSYPHHFDFRLALSATPDRWFDDAGTMALRTYFGKTVFEFPLAQAIGVNLTPYYYYPHLVELTEDELDQYQQLSLKIARLFGGNDPEIQDAYERLLIKRARLLNEAVNKLSVLSKLLEQQSNKVSHALFYCAPGQIDAVMRLLGWEKGLLVHRFTAQEPNAERQQLLRRFASGQLHGLVAMKCLDEGVDVPSTRTAYFLASSGNPREFIQRRGRILRRFEGKECAIIHDLIAMPPVKGRSSQTYKAERTIMRRELARFHEFASMARNKHEAVNVIWELASHYQLRDFE